MLSSLQIAEVFTILDQTIESPTTELEYVNNFTLLVAVVLSAQAKDSSVNLVTKDLFKVVTTPRDMINLGEEKLIEHIKKIGLYKNKAKNIMQLSHTLMENYNSIVPNTLEDLMTLPGVGRKTANVILNVAFKEPTMAVDTHVFRVAKRIGLSRGGNVLQVEQDLLKVIPLQYQLKAHHLLILHGRYVCKARGLNCSICKISHICTFDSKVFK